MPYIIHSGKDGCFFCKSPPGKGSQAIRQAFARPLENPWFRWQIWIRCQEKDIKNTSFNMFKRHWDVNNINVSNKLRNMVMENLSRKAAHLRDPSRKVMVESIPAVTRHLGVVNQLSSGKYWDVIGHTIRTYGYMKLKPAWKSKSFTKNRHFRKVALYILFLETHIHAE